jgi:hypothetical protein
MVVNELHSAIFIVIARPFANDSSLGQLQTCISFYPAKCPPFEERKQNIIKRDAQLLNLNQ